MNKLTLMVDMDEVIVAGRFQDFLNEFLKGADFSQLKGLNRQELIAGRENEFRKIYQYKNLYKNDDGTFVKPFDDCVDVLKRLNQKYEVYIVTSYVYDKDIFDSITNMKNKIEYLNYYFPFIDNKHHIFISDKSLVKFSIGIDDREKNLVGCDKKFLFTEFRNKNISNNELSFKNIIRVNNWLEIEKLIDNI